MPSREGGDRELCEATSDDGAPLTTPEDAHRALLDRLHAGGRLSGARLLLLVLLTIGLAGALMGVPRWMIVLAGVVGFVMIALAGNAERPREVLLLYDFEADDAGRRHQRVLEVFQKTMKCSRKEFVREGPLEGGFRPVSATPITSYVSCRAPRFETNVPMPVLRSAWRSIYLLPDGVLAFDDHERTEALVPYRDLIVEYGQSPVVEVSPPDDAALIYPPSGPGEIAVPVYDWIRLATRHRVIALMQLSKRGTAVAFAEALEGAGAKLLRA